MVCSNVGVEIKKKENIIKVKVTVVCALIDSNTFCIISSKQSDPTRGTKEIYTSMKDMERFFQVGCFLVYRRHSKAI